MLWSKCAPYSCHEHTLNNIYSGITAEEAARYQQRYPIKRDDPVLVYVWGSGGTQEVKLEETPDPEKTSDQQRSAWEVAGKKKATKQAKQPATVDTKDSDEVGGVKLNDTLNQEDPEQTAVDAAVAKKKAKKAAKKARKAARTLENAKPPVGKRRRTARMTETTLTGLKPAGPLLGLRTRRDK